MQTADVIHERVRFGCDECLAGIVGYPAHGNPPLAVLLCSPHPNYGGDMENNVVAALAEGLSVEAVTLRFDYRGIGESRIELPAGISAFDYWEKVEETLDYAEPLSDTAAALDHLASLSAGLPMVAIGYSFGAIMGTNIAVNDCRIVAMAGISPPLKRVRFEHLTNCAKPCMIVSGQDDFVYDAQTAEALVTAAGASLILHRPAGDHFFVGAEMELVDQVAQFLKHAVL
jgi:alpha/beta superfamily hydrolase